MSSSTTEKRYIFSRVLLKETGNEREDGHMVSIHLLKQSRCWHDHPSDYISETTVDAQVERFVPSTDVGGLYMEDVQQNLTRMGFTSYNDRMIIIFKIDEERLAAARRRCSLIVLIADVTVRVLDSFDDHDAIDNSVTASPDINFNLNIEGEGLETFTVREVDYHGNFSDAEYRDTAGTMAGTRHQNDATVTEELGSQIDSLTILQSFETQRIRFVPATTSSVKKLQKVRLDSLEESIVKLNPSCSICKDDFAEGGMDQLVIPLPCTHCYHVECIMSWLEVSHVCPLCRYALPTVPSELDSEASNS